ncbi:MAG: TetR/AcrR family transcriptional regulator [Tannerellaceae bacterium]|jgi:AcrR family transcriptional regulator|nr:TetR/AcrR family transcriptional regulator [Tannerellaceae bacterium]
MVESTRNTEQTILNAAEQIFFEKGYAGSKTTDIAKQAGVTHAMLHYYFRTKENLFQIVVKKQVSLLANSILPILNDEGSFTEIITRAIDRHFDFVRQNPHLVFFVIREIHSNALGKQVWQEMAAPILGNIVKNMAARIDAEKAAGTLPQDLEPVNFLITLISLNLFVFIAQPLFFAVANIDQSTFERILEERKKENIRIVLTILQRQSFTP